MADKIRTAVEAAEIITTTAAGTIDPYEVDTEPDVNDYYDEDGLITCPLCGNRWDGNAQCYPCILPDDLPTQQQ